MSLQPDLVVLIFSYLPPPKLRSFVSHSSFFSASFCEKYLHIRYSSAILSDFRHSHLTRLKNGLAALCSFLDDQDKIAEVYAKPLLLGETLWRIRELRRREEPAAEKICINVEGLIREKLQILFQALSAHRETLAVIVSAQLAAFEGEVICERGFGYPDLTNRLLESLKVAASFECTDYLIAALNYFPIHFCYPADFTFTKLLRAVTSQKVLHRLQSIYPTVFCVAS